MEYVGERHARHLQMSLEEGKKYSVIDIKWDYAPIHKNRKSCLSMEDYIKYLPIKVGHIKQIKSHLSPYKYTPFFYGSRNKFTANTDMSAPLDAKGIFRVQNIVCALLYYGRAVDKKLMVSFSTIGSQQAAATVDTAVDVKQLLEYIATYPHDGITYRASGMILEAHSDASYLN